MVPIRTWRLAAGACLGLLAACAVGPEFKRPELEPALQYAAVSAPVAEDQFAADSTAQRVRIGVALSHDWWRLFQSEAMNAIVQRALLRNRSLAAAAAALDQADALTQAQRATRAPRLDANLSAGRQKYGSALLGTPTSLPPFTYFSIGATVSYALDYTGGVARSLEQRQALREYQRNQLEAARLAVSGNAVTLILRIASIRAQLVTAEKLLDRDHENLSLVETAFEAGSAARLDVVTARSQLAEDMTALPPLRKDLAVASHALSVLTGDLPTANQLPEIDLAHLTLPQDLPVSVPSELARRRPDIRAAESQLHAATAAVGVATSNLYPHIELSASVGQQAVIIGQLFNHDARTWGLTSSLLGPIFDGGALRAERRAAMEVMHASLANYEQTVLEAFAQVANALEALAQDGEELQAQSRAEAAARDAVELTRQSYQEGGVTVLQVLDAERQLQRVKLGHVRAVAQRYVDTVQLLLAVGPDAAASPGPDAAASGG